MTQVTPPWKCGFCRMPTHVRLGRLPLCPICREQLNDFLWVSLVLGVAFAAGAISSLSFMVEEILMFFVLIFLKHRFPGVLERFIEEAS